MHNVRAFLFQFPSNGKADPKNNMPNWTHLWLSESFNSLQTGKRIQRQFAKILPWLSTKEVSIPFKRERGSKGWSWLRSEYLTECFNSLQTGTRIQRITYKLRDVFGNIVSIPFKRESGSKALSPSSVAVGRISVSIPFKRERGSKDIGGPCCWDSCKKVSIPFKRESGSKDRTAWGISWCGIQVSIPFKRESGSKDMIRVSHPDRKNMFQFPSNGKADPKF